jgi:hypothetical protein
MLPFKVLNGRRIRIISPTVKKLTCNLMSGRYLIVLLWSYVHLGLSYHVSHQKCVIKLSIVRIRSKMPMPLTVSRNVERNCNLQSCAQCSFHNHMCMHVSKRLILCFSPSLRLSLNKGLLFPYLGLKESGRIKCY